MGKLNDLREIVKKKVKEETKFNDFFNNWIDYINMGWTQQEYQNFGCKFDDAKNNISRMSNENEILLYLYNLFIF